MALYRKFRPNEFEDVKGQDAIVRTLKNQIEADRIGHAYLFCGTRGTGKTTVAKIFAKAVNCEHPIDGSPCGECAVCKAIAEGNSMVNVGVLDGDLVVVRKQDFADEGQIVVALVPDENGSGETATLKRYYVDHARNKVRLRPENDEITDFYVNDIKILGVAKSVVKQLD